MKKILLLVSIIIICFSSAVLADEIVQLSSIEQAYRNIGIEESQVLRQYGYDLFSSWRPVGVGPIDDSYLVGPGDVLRLYIWGDPVEFGELQSTYELPVAQDGRLFFQPLGRISVWGSTLSRITEVIREQLMRRFRNFEIDIIPAEVRQIPVFVSGFVHNPGVVTASSLSSVLDILSEAGGVTHEGSLRDIRLMRRDGSIVKVDLYDLFIFGRGQLPGIRDGDIIIVPPVGKVAASGGEVVRPGIYEITEGETIEDVLKFSGGIKLSGSRDKGTLLRREGDGYVVSEGSAVQENFLKKQVQSGDLLLFASGRSARADLVTVRGHVLYPGVYSLNDTPSLSRLLEKSRMRPDADLEFGTIVRIFPEREEHAYIVFNPAEVLKGNVDYVLTYMDYVELYRRETTLPASPIQVFGEIEGGITAYREGITLLDVLSNRNVVNPAEFQARIIRDGDTADIVLLRDLLVRGNLERNLLLKPGDRVVVVRNERSAYHDGSVRVLGSVTQPGVFDIMPGMRLSDALETAGGFTDLAYPQGMVVIRDSVRKEQIQQFQQSAAQLERQIEQLSSAIAAQSLSAEVRVTLQSQIAQQQTILDLAYERAETMFGRISLGIGKIDNPSKIRGTVDDILLEDGDFIYVPKEPGFVSIFGDINSGIAVPYDPDKTVRGYLQDVGSIDTRNHKIMILRVNGKIVRGEKTVFGGTTLAREKLQPGDVIFAQREIRIPSGVSFKNNLLELIDAVGSISYTILTTMQVIDKL